MIDPSPACRLPRLKHPVSREYAVSAILPSFNEPATVAVVIQRLRELPIRVEIVVVDDGSTDQTPRILRALWEAGEIAHLITHPRNQGKGSSIRSALPR